MYIHLALCSICTCKNQLNFSSEVIMAANSFFCVVVAFLIVFIALALLPAGVAFVVIVVAVVKSFKIIGFFFCHGTFAVSTGTNPKKPTALSIKIKIFFVTDSKV